jgi:hypothetical protein
VAKLEAAFKAGSEDPEFVALVGSLKKARPEDAWPE